MALFDAFLLDATKMDVWVAVRTDGVAGSGTARDPYNGAARRNPPIPIALSSVLQEATVSTAVRHGLIDGDVVEIGGATGQDADLWNGTFGIYGATEFSFKYYMKKPPANPAGGNPTVTRLTFPFDEVMRKIPASTRIHLGPGTFQTRGFGTNAAGAIDERGFQTKSGWKISGAGVGVTTLQLMGADQADYHYHAVGMPIEPTGTTAITPLESFEVSDLTIDCKADDQPGRPNPGYANVACGAVRILANHSRISRVKAIHWGTKSLKQGCFVLSIIQASGKPSGEDTQPIITETTESGIEDCIAVDPSKNNAREATVLHLGGLKNTSNQAQGFGRAPFIRRNFVDCTFLTSEPIPKVVPSAFITSAAGTQVEGSGNDTGKFVGKRSVFWTAQDVGTYVRFHNPRDLSSRWNGCFPIFQVAPFFGVDLASSQGTTNSSDFVIMGTEFRGIAVTSCHAAVVEQNQVHNCWIGGPYQSPLDDSVTDPSVPPTLAREERLDPLNALNTRSLIVRNNHYRNVAVGPYWNMGGMSGAVAKTAIGAV